MSKKNKIKIALILAFSLPFFLFLIKTPLKEEKKNKENSLKHPFLTPLKENLTEPVVVFSEKNFAKSTLPPYVIFSQSLAARGIENEQSQERNEILEYSVEPGETLSSIAQKFNLSIETILWANDLSKNSSLKPGQKLIILPVDGIIHHVSQGDTIFKIASLYKANFEEIMEYNNLESPDDIFPGDILIIPGGKMPPKKPSSSLVPLSDVYFICPVIGGCKITQGLHWYNAVDFSNGKCGESIVAAAGGLVQKVKYGWNGGAGNLVTILHPNGVITHYYHLQTIFVSPGQEVSQGEIIGLMGNTGKVIGSTGCHLHFGVSGALNPFAR